MSFGHEAPGSGHTEGEKTDLTMTALFIRPSGTDTWATYATMAFCTQTKMPYS